MAGGILSGMDKEEPKLPVMSCRQLTSFKMKLSLPVESRGNRDEKNVSQMWENMIGGTYFSTYPFDLRKALKGAADSAVFGLFVFVDLR
jgi:hypothetical protein